MAVFNGNPTQPAFSISEPWQITEINNYHWNDAQGKTPGTIALQSSDGTQYGPWQASGLPGQGGVMNAYWVVNPDIVIPAGTYTIIDSDPSTWSTNDNVGGMGMVRVRGFKAE